ncbi:polysaccharide biosynthesis protein [Lactobacillus sp. CBA3606]|uniref:polysaccharide biosynthesis protein n=1 Tax=Lactobacillus sp. CBA3606 TaxID=2099789 RepID=UPI001F43F7AD|nr:polysaccharide biosynthesis protein [Lactobacillus sp. CBA3606]
MQKIKKQVANSRLLKPENLYLITLAAYLISVTIQTTTFNAYYPQIVGSVIQLGTIAIMLVKIVGFDDLTSGQVIQQLSLLGLIVVVALTSGAHYLMTTVLLAMGARQVSFRQILKLYLMIVGTILLVAFIAAELGLIANITFATSDGVRQSFGVVYTTDFAAHIFYLSCAYLYLRAKAFRLIDLLPVGLALMVIYLFTKTLTDVLAMLILLGLYVIYIYRRQLNQRWFIAVILRYAFLAMPIMSVVIVQLSAGFNYHERIFLKLNTLFSSRLSLGNNAILAYGFKLLGQSPIYVNGWGGSRVATFKNGIGDLTYFYIDSSYLNMLIAYGVLLTLVIVIGTSFFLYQRSKANDYLLPIIFVAIAFSSGFDQHLLEVTYNIFILAFFAILPRYQTQIGPAFERQVVTQSTRTNVATEQGKSQRQPNFRRHYE